MPKNVAPMHVNRMSRHPHDVTAGYTTTLTTGQIIPMYFDVLSPGDSMYYRTHAFARLQEVVTAFLGEVDIHLDYFFVPLQMLYTPFGQVFANTNDFVSVFFTLDQTSSENFPLLDVVGTLDNKNTNSIPFEGGECWGKSCMRLLDAFNLNPLAVANPAVAANPQSATRINRFYTGQKPITPWIVAAYQAIYQKYFRNESFERLVVKSYNFDNMYNSEGSFTENEMLTLRYCQRPSDYFTDIKVSPIASSINAQGSTRGLTWEAQGGSPQELYTQVRQWLGGNLNSFGDGFLLDEAHVSRAFDGNGNSFNDFLPDSSRLSRAGSTFGNWSAEPNAQSIRVLFALDKYLRVYGRAGKTYDDQMLAHFGVKIPHDVKHDLTHLKHYKFGLMTDVVYNTTNDADNNSLLGQVGGQGSASLDSEQEKFTAPVHGVFMCVAHAVTKPRYCNTYSKLHHLSDRLSFPIPEYDKLGSQPLWAFEASPFFMYSDDASSDNGWNVNARLGWQYRYSEFKRKWNRISMAYFNGQFYSDTDDEPAFLPDVNAFNPWILSRSPFEGLHSYGTPNPADAWTDFFVLQKRMFYEKPDALNNVMVQQYTNGWSNEYFTKPWLAFQTDPIIFEYECFAKKVSWMSPTGEPDL